MYSLAMASLNNDYINKKETKLRLPLGRLRLVYLYLSGVTVGLIMTVRNSKMNQIGPCWYWASLWNVQALESQFPNSLEPGLSR